MALRAAAFLDSCFEKSKSTRPNAEHRIDRQLVRAAIASALAITLLGGAHAADFPTVVANILNSQTDSRLSRMGPAQKQEMINCVNTVLVKLPNGKKRFIVEGGNLGEQEDRFGKVVKENRAEWEQKIAKACSSIAVRRGGIGHN